MRLVSVLLLLFALTCEAGVEVQKFTSPELEARYKVLINELRCLVCQNQNIADSNASLAKTLRQETLRMINEGASDEEIIQFMVTRYGDFVLYKPPLKAQTLLLWVGPFILLVAGFFIALLIIRRSRQAGSLNEEVTEETRRLLDSEDSAQ